MHATLVLFSITLLAVSVSAAPTTLSSEGRLHIIRVADNSLEAIFYNADAGIRIRANSLSLSLYSMDGEELLLSGDKPHGSSLFATIMGHSFLEYNTTLEDGTQKMVDYAIPDSLTEQTKEAVKSAKVERMLSQLEDNDTQAATDSAFQELFQRPEIALIESAALALGRAGVMGYENQGALNFYMVARALIGASGREELVEENVIVKGGNEDARQDQAIGNHRQQKRYAYAFFLAQAALWASSIPASNHYARQNRPYEYCNNINEYCYGCPEDENCHGMCGRGCTCWRFVCGNCCYHGGCSDHDSCCGRSGWLRRLLCWVPIGFNCLFFLCP